jgi:hypothetical protein
VATEIQQNSGVPKPFSAMTGHSSEMKHIRLLYVKVVFKEYVISLITTKKYFLPKISTNIHRIVDNPVITPKHSLQTCQKFCV